MAPCSPVVSDQPAFWHLDAARGPSTPSLNHLVSELLEMQRHLNTELFRGFEVDHHLDFCQKFNRQITRFRSLQNLVDESSSALRSFCLVNAIAHEATGLDVL